MLIETFDQTFSKFNTKLVANGDEPIYLPQKHANDYNRIVFAHDYFSSALHEVAHWCIAGPERRKREDYGYWYSPDGRNQSQQQAFEKVEIKPQALEWAFSIASNQRFRVSTDNLNGYQPNVERFTQQVKAQLENFIVNGFPTRAQQFIDALHQAFSTDKHVLNSVTILDTKNGYDD